MIESKFSGIYISYSELLRDSESAVANLPTNDEMDEIYRVSKLVEELDRGNLRYCTTT